MFTFNHHIAYDCDLANLYFNDFKEGLTRSAILRDYPFLLQPVSGANSAISHFLENPNAESLGQLFASLLQHAG